VLGGIACAAPAIAANEQTKIEVITLLLHLFFERSYHQNLFLNAEVGSKYKNGLVLPKSIII